MLKMFKAKNFYSFKDEVILDMRAVSYKDMKSHVIDDEDNKVVKTLAIYGKNASGKSNLLKAMYYFKSFVCKHFFDECDVKNRTICLENSMPKLIRQPFRLDKEIDAEFEFDIMFCQDKKNYQYGFAINDDYENNSYTITREWLLFDNKKVYERDVTGITYGSSYAKEMKKITVNRKEKLYIGALDYFADGKVKEIVDCVKDYLCNKLYFYNLMLEEWNIKNEIKEHIDAKRMLEDENYKKILDEFMRIADVGVDGVHVEKIEAGNGIDALSSSYIVKTIHNIYAIDGEVIRQEMFNIQEESAGTKSYFSLIQKVINIIEMGGVIFVDEISAKLHPVLIKFIMDIFHNDNNKTGQMIFTTNDISLMDKKYFRRDEIGLVEKNKSGESSFYKLSDIKIRSDASFAKDYLNGKYGAIPIIDDDCLVIETVGKWGCRDYTVMK